MLTFDFFRRPQSWWVVVLEGAGGGRYHVELFACDAAQAGLKALDMIPGARITSVWPGRVAAQANVRDAVPGLAMPAA